MSYSEAVEVKYENTDNTYFKYVFLLSNNWVSGILDWTHFLYKLVN